MKWDKENLINDFFEDAEKLREKCGLKYYTPELAHRIECMVISQNADGETRAAYPGNKPDDGCKDSEGTYLCRICRAEQPDDEAVQMGCGHKFCAECYQGYVVNAAGSGPACVMTTCPEHKCTEVLPSTMFKKLCDVQSWRVYKQHLLVTTSTSRSRTAFVRRQVAIK